MGVLVSVCALMCESVCVCVRCTLKTVLKLVNMRVQPVLLLKKLKTVIFCVCFPSV